MSTVATTNATGYQVVAQSITPFEDKYTLYYSMDKILQ